MHLDLKRIKVYLVSPGSGKYRPRLHTVFERLVDAGYTNIEFFRSIPADNGTNSLTKTNIEIFKKELNNDEPFMIIEDDCQDYFKHDNITIPDDADALYLGVANWVYPHSYETLGKGFHIREHNETDHIDIDNTVTRIRGMTSTHAVIYFNREYMSRFINSAQSFLDRGMCISLDLVFATLQHSHKVYALKRPIYYQDSTLGGQESFTRIVYNGNKYI
jgi:hypothetical protein